MDVTDVIRDRMQEPPGLQATAVVSALVHAVALAAIVLLSGGLFGERARQPRTVMTISLGGGNDGPENGGMTSIGGRPVQAVIPPEEVKAARTCQTACRPDAGDDVAQARASGDEEPPPPVGEASARRGARPDADAGRGNERGQRPRRNRRARPGFRSLDRRRCRARDRGSTSPIFVVPST